MLLLLLRRRRRRGATAKRRPEALLLIARRAATSSSKATSSRSTLRGRRTPRVVHAHAGGTPHGRPPDEAASGPRRARRGVCRRRGAAARAWDRSGGDGLREQELGEVVADVGAVLESRVMLVADDRLRERKRERESGKRERKWEEREKEEVEK